jgi:hypothetical protein
MVRKLLGCAIVEYSSSSAAEAWQLVLRGKQIFLKAAVIESAGCVSSFMENEYIIEAE